MLTFISTMTAEPGDKEFMVKLYKKYERLMYATAQKRLSDPEACQDIVQESLLKLIPKIPFLRVQVPYIHASYITAVVRNTAINYLKKQNRTVQWCSSLDESTPTEPEVSGPTLEELMELAERKECLMEVWNKLPEEDRLLLEGKYLLEYTDKELAGMLGCKASSIRMKLTRARRRAAQKILEKAGDLIE